MCGLLSTRSAVAGSSSNACTWSLWVRQAPTGSSSTDGPGSRVMPGPGGQETGEPLDQVPDDVAGRPARHGGRGVPVGGALDAGGEAARHPAVERGGIGLSRTDSRFMGLLLRSSGAGCGSRPGRARSAVTTAGVRPRRLKMAPGQRCSRPPAGAPELDAAALEHSERIGPRCSGQSEPPAHRDLRTDRSAGGCRVRRTGASAVAVMAAPPAGRRSRSA